MDTSVLLAELGHIQVLVDTILANAYLDQCLTLLVPWRVIKELDDIHLSVSKLM